MLVFPILKTISICIILTWILTVAFSWKFMFPIPFGEYVGPFAGIEISFSDALEQGTGAWAFFFFIMGGVFTPIISALMHYWIKTRDVLKTDFLNITISAFIPAFFWCLVLALLKSIIGEW